MPPRGSRKGPARCAGAWTFHPDHELGNLADDQFVCPPCHRSESNVWLVKAGYSLTLVEAGCEKAARAELARRLRLQQVVPMITARPATGDDVAMWNDLVEQDRNR